MSLGECGKLMLPIKHLSVVFSWLMAETAEFLLPHSTSAGIWQVTSSGLETDAIMLIAKHLSHSSTKMCI